MTTTLNPPYSIILADPPWEYSNDLGGDPAYGGITYEQMSDDELAALPVSNIAAKDALLFCWLVMPRLEFGLAMMRAWGFRPTACAFTWVKLNPSSPGAEITSSGVFLHRGVYSGLGSYTCGNAELCYIGRRGRGVPRIDKSVKQILFAPRGRHSAKPDVHGYLDRMYDPEQYRRIELFARRQPPSPHWDATGFDYDQRDIRDVVSAQVRDGKAYEPEALGTGS